MDFDVLQSQTKKINHPRLANDERLYIFGDIHGRFDLLRRVYMAIKNDLASFPIQHSKEIFLGDYVDRGQDSASVIDFLANRPPLCGERICLLGNHEEILLSVLHDPSLLKNWQKHGGGETLLSYGVTPCFDLDNAEAVAIQKALRRALPLSHYHFLTGLQDSFVYKDHYFVHAGVRPGVLWDEQSRRDKLWIRHDFLQTKPDWDGLVIHGHTPVDVPDVSDKRINIDTGAWSSGRLTCLVLEGEHHRFITS